MQEEICANRRFTDWLIVIDLDISNRVHTGTNKLSSENSADLHKFSYYKLGSTGTPFPL